ncbi:hypothetical protein D3C78_660940 [compost metagenome]
MAAQVGGDRLGQVVPAGAAAAAGVIQPGRAGIAGGDARHQRRRGRGEGRTAGRIAELVGDHAHLGALAQQALHGEQEVVAVAAVQPAATQDQVRPAGRSDGLFAAQLAVPVDIQRCAGVGFPVWPAEAAVEHVVGGVVQQPGAQRGGLLGHHGGSLGVEGEGCRRLALGLLHRGVRRGVDHQLRSFGLQHAAQRGPVVQVQFGAGQHLQFAEAGQQRGEAAAELTVGAEEENLHGNTSAASRSGPSASRGESSGASSSGQGMASCASSQRRQRSCAGEK